jgi:hypothetical protein
MGLLSFLVLVGIAYLIWRISDQLPDVIFRVSEIQRDVAEIRRSLAEPAQETPAAVEAPAMTTSAPADSAAEEAG